MATVDATTTTTTAAADESGNKQPDTAAAATAPPPPPPPPRRRSTFCGGSNLALRVLLLAVTVAGLVLLIIGKQTVHYRVAQFPGFVVFSRSAEFNDSPALIYLLVALCATCLYSLLTALASFRLIFGSSPTKTLLLLVLLDALYAAIMASATGSAGGVAWIGLKGNTHTNWSEICSMYGKFCRYIGSSIFLSLAASIILVLLTIVNAHSLYRCSR